jgi:O-antigen/teichoic acid export membrane protein
MSTNASGNTAKIAANTFWYGLEMVFEIVTAFATSLVLARTFGPERLGYFNYIMWLTNLSGSIGGLGLPVACRKYMAEALGQGRPELARAIFEHGFRRHILLSLGVTAAGSAAVLTLSDPLYRTASLLQVLSVLPGMLRFLPSQANMAAERLRANVPGSIIGQSCYIAGVLGSIAMGWGLEGVAAGILTARTVEFVVRAVPVMRWMRQLPVMAMPADLLTRFRRFARDSVFTQLFHLIVWDRSDMIFLERLARSRAEISFFSVAVNLTDKMLMAPMALAQSTGVTLMAQYGRSAAAMPEMAASTIKFIVLMSTPLLWGMAALGPVVVPMLYGREFAPAGTALTWAASLAVFRGLRGPGVSYLQAIEQQRFVLVCNLLCAGVNVALDILWIPRYQALGAVAASGVAQFLAIAGVWGKAIQAGRIPVPWRAIAGILGAGAMMAAGVNWLVRIEPAWLGVAVSIPAGAIFYTVGLRLFGVLDQRDAARLDLLKRRLPSSLQPLWSQASRLLLAQKP